MIKWNNKGYPLNKSAIFLLMIFSTLVSASSETDEKVNKMEQELKETDESASMDPTRAFLSLINTNCEDLNAVEKSEGNDKVVENLLQCVNRIEEFCKSNAENKNCVTMGPALIPFIKSMPKDKLKQAVAGIKQQKENNNKIETVDHIDAKHTDTVKHKQVEHKQVEHKSVEHKKSVHRELAHTKAEGSSKHIEGNKLKNYKPEHATVEHVEVNHPEVNHSK